MTKTREDQIQDEIRVVYNTGEVARAVQMACKFAEEYPSSYQALYMYAVMHGDWADSPEHTADERARLLAIAKKGISELFHSAEKNDWPSRFQFSVRNEYYWFFELPEEQFNLGLERLERGENGHYSACVGASMMALKELRASHLSLAEQWARTSLEHFVEFEKAAPHWYNINYFSSQAFACLGRYDEATACFKDMFRKQAGPENVAEISKFRSLVADIRHLRGG